jgi:hypothetical protein
MTIASASRGMSIACHRSGMTIACLTILSAYTAIGIYASAVMLKLGQQSYRRNGTKRENAVSGNLWHGLYD